MKTGPKASFGFDLALTEVFEADRHYFVVEVGTERGAEILQVAPHRPASESERRKAEEVIERTATQMGRTLDTNDIKGLLYRNYEHPRWDEVTSRCLACANCTMVCPTCFCTTVEDVTDLKGEHAERWRRWDSCFTVDFTYIHGGSVRSTPRSRYRQRLLRAEGDAEHGFFELVARRPGSDRERIDARLPHFLCVGRAISLGERIA